MEPRKSAPRNKQALPALRKEAPSEGTGASVTAVDANNLPDYADKADDLEAIKKAVDDAASVGGGLWLSYLFVLFYLAVAAGAVTHADLFFEKPVRLPFLGVDLPLLAFFVVAPILFLIVHAYTLVHLAMLADKAKRYHQALYKQISDENLAGDELKERKAMRDGLRRQLPSNVFVQFLAGPSDIRGGSFGWALRAIAWITLVFAPVLLLLLFQLQFLPFHDSFVTWTQRIVLLLDLGLIWWLWRKILSGRANVNRHVPRGVKGLVSGALSALVVIFSIAIATFPGEWLDNGWAAWPLLPSTDAQNRPVNVSLHDWLFNSPINEVTRSRRLPFSNTLVLIGVGALENLGIDDPDKAKWRDFIFRARGRNLSGANFDFGSFPRVDFDGADLVGASLRSTQLNRSSFTGAQLSGASFDEAQLRGTSLRYAQLQQAKLRHAELQGASLFEAQLQGASLDNAQLQGAWLDNARLQGAYLPNAELQGAKLRHAKLQGASLYRAQLQGASLYRAQLQGASLSDAQLQGTSFRQAQLQGAWIGDASLEATDLSETSLWRTQGDGAMLAGILMSDAADTWGPIWRVEDENFVDRRGDPIYQVLRWDEAAFRSLWETIDSIAVGPRRLETLHDIRSLDCAVPRPALASCDPRIAWVPPLAPPPEALAWRHALEAAKVDIAAYRPELAKVLRNLVCSGNPNAIFIVRGEGFQSRLAAAGPEAPALIDEITAKDSKTCPVSALLTDADRAQLLAVKQQAIEAAKPTEK